MNPPFLVYIRQGCPHCQTVTEFLKSQNVTFEVEDIGWNPIVTVGLQSYLGSLTVPTPVTMCFMTQEVVAGANLEQLSRSIAAYRSLCTIPPNPVVHESQTSEVPANGQAAQ